MMAEEKPFLLATVATMDVSVHVNDKTISLSVNVQSIIFVDIDLIQEIFGGEPENKDFLGYL